MGWRVRRPPLPGAPREAGHCACWCYGHATASGCEEEKDSMARIAVGGFQHETNTFAPQQATWEEFVRADAWPPLLRGPEMIAGVEGFNIPIAGAVKRLAELGHESGPPAWAAGGP